MTWTYAAADNQATLDAKFLGSSRLDSERCFFSWGLSRSFLFFHKGIKPRQRCSPLIVLLFGLCFVESEWQDCES